MDGGGNNLSSDAVMETNLMEGMNAEIQHKQIMVINEEETNKDMKNNISIVKDSSTTNSPFGPWMLVKNPPRFKGKQFNPSNDHTPSMKAKGSRFASLIEETEDEENLIEYETGPSISAEANLNQVGLVVSPKKTIRVCDPLAGRNSQHRPFKNNNQQSQLRTKPTMSGSLRPPQASHKSHENILSTHQNDEQRKQMKEKEKAILHKMRILEKQGIGNIDSFCTQVLLPPSSNFNLVYSRQEVNSEATLPPKPPDLAAESSGGINQNASMEVDCVVTEPKGNEASLSSPHHSSIGLEDQTQKLDQ
ncbi:hypothetical protein RIF29_10697 [Crotalaria pallida]|uniref:Uncharacterized protein n=1 Tax=Crotalaria pallida TaxID=3830 RepID=A0AAN9IKU9_CROPI